MDDFSKEFSLSLSPLSISTTLLVGAGYFALGFLLAHKETGSGFPSQVLLVTNDLEMRQGKIAARRSHAMVVCMKSSFVGLCKLSAGTFGYSHK
ncbi:hypothetical protein C4D60_Mb07t13740 [Musa balbisiana]|uniref:peptidyl-tRNA hydrolase n=1 Tax=Musa balbisiana TaxID=52838 RepID=A0A4S8JF36_MUSBA|nr:hypothetical protein C4D60_Mb07t13740 [Musa balbisiana]